MKVVIEMKLYITLKDYSYLYEVVYYHYSIYGISKVVLEILQYLQLHSPFQLVVLDGRIVNFHLHTKNYNKQFKLFTVANKISDIAISFMGYDFVTF